MNLKALQTLYDADQRDKYDIIFEDLLDGINDSSLASQVESHWLITDVLLFLNIEDAQKVSHQYRWITMREMYALYCQTNWSVIVWQFHGNFYAYNMFNRLPTETILLSRPHPKTPRPPNLTRDVVEYILILGGLPFISAIRWSSVSRHYRHVITQRCNAFWTTGVSESYETFISAFVPRILRFRSFSFYSTLSAFSVESIRKLFAQETLHLTDIQEVIVYSRERWRIDTKHLVLWGKVGSREYSVTKNTSGMTYFSTLRNGFAKRWFMRVADSTPLEWQDLS